MYQIKQSKPFHDQLSIETKTGETKVFDVTINITPQLAKDYRAIQIKLLELNKKHNENKEDFSVITGIGECVVDAMKLLLGEENTKELVEIYDEDYTSMLYDVFPYINEVIVPEIQKIAREKKQQVKTRFKR